MILSNHEKHSIYILLLLRTNYSYLHEDSKEPKSVPQTSVTIKK